MSNGVGNPPQPWRWAHNRHRRTWHVILPAANGQYRASLCGYHPPHCWAAMRAEPPERGEHTCITCYTYAYRQGAPVR